MKKSIDILILIILMLLSSNLFSQEIKFSDLLNSSKRPKGQFTSYVSKDGAVYKTSDILTIGHPSSEKTFAFIKETAGLNSWPLSVTGSGNKGEIKFFVVEGSNRLDYIVTVRCKGSFALSGYYIQLENAIETGEVKSFGLTSDEALSELKKAKDKLDLGIISQAKYDSLKIEYSKFIK